MNILGKNLFGVIVVSACVVVLLLWGGIRTCIAVQPNLQTGQQIIQPDSPSGRQPVRSRPQMKTVQQIYRQAVQVTKRAPHPVIRPTGDNKNAPVVAVNIQPKHRKPVAQVQKESTEQLGKVSVIRRMQTGNLLTQPVNRGEPVKINLQRSVLAKTEKAGGTGSVNGFGLDVGNGLPLPATNNTLIAPQDRPTGFHVGVDYYLDQNWELTGLAGVTTNEGIVTNSVTKPSLNQVGIQAGYRF
ncbi:MAG: hypothetical protein M0Z83_06140 [Betaproteobacteria bacterium]|nr:hypothetical protein [Betaproteobacteria bacterium]